MKLLRSLFHFGGVGYLQPQLENLEHQRDDLFPIIMKQLYFSRSWESSLNAPHHSGNFRVHRRWTDILQFHVCLSAVLFHGLPWINYVVRLQNVLSLATISVPVTAVAWLLYSVYQCPPIRLAVTSGHEFSLRADSRGLQRNAQLRGRVRDK